MLIMFFLGALLPLYLLKYKMKMLPEVQHIWTIVCFWCGVDGYGIDLISGICILTVVAGFIMLTVALRKAIFEQKESLTFA